MSQPNTTDRDCQEAVALAEASLREANMQPDEYALIRAENALTGTATCPGPRCWRLTLKRRDLLPTEMPAELTAGGEVFVEVDLAAGKAAITRHGE